MRFARLTELSLAPCAARRLWARTRSSAIPRNLHGFQRRLQCRTRLDERFSDLFLLLSDVELGRNGARERQKFTIPKFDLSGCEKMLSRLALRRSSTTFAPAVRRLCTAPLPPPPPAGTSRLLQWTRASMVAAQTSAIVYLSLIHI